MVPVKEFDPAAVTLFASLSELAVALSTVKPRMVAPPVKEEAVVVVAPRPVTVAKVSASEVRPESAAQYHVSVVSFHFKICPSEHPCNMASPPERSSKPEPDEVVEESASAAAGSSQRETATRSRTSDIVASRISSKRHRIGSNGGGKTSRARTGHISGQSNCLIPGISTRSSARDI